MHDVMKAVNDSIAATYWARAGLMRLRPEFAQQLRDLPRGGRSEIMIADDADPDVDGPGRPFAVWLLEDVVRNFQADGQAHQLLMQQWVITMASRWEVLRPRLAAARGVDLNDVAINAFGDLNRVRNDLVHNVGIANQSATRCHTLRWFKEGEEIVLLNRHFFEFVDALPWPMPADIAFGNDYVPGSLRRAGL